MSIVSSGFLFSVSAFFKKISFIHVFHTKAELRVQCIQVIALHHLVFISLHVIFLSMYSPAVTDRRRTSTLQNLVSLQWALTSCSTCTAPNMKMRGVIGNQEFAKRSYYTGWRDRFEGVGEYFFYWTSSFIYIYNTVIVNGAHLKGARISSGGPQGSVDLIRFESFYQWPCGGYW